MKEIATHRTGWLPSHNRGFTLLEVILAIFISIGVLLVVLFFYRQAANLRSQLLIEAEGTSAARLIMDLITLDLRNACLHASRQTGLIGESNAVEFLKADFPSKNIWNEGVLGRATSIETDYRLISYRLMVSPDGTNVTGIMRKEKPFVQPRIFLTEEEIPTQETIETNKMIVPPVITELRLLNFRYWDGFVWQEFWTGKNLPKGVEVTLGTKPLLEGAETNLYEGELFRRVIYLPGSSANSDWMPNTVKDAGTNSLNSTNNLDADAPMDLGLPGREGAP